MTTPSLTTSAPAARSGDDHRHLHVAAYRAVFSVESAHGTLLEFVLDAADKRRGRPSRIELSVHGRTFTTYSEALMDMLREEFVSEPSVRILRMDEYGQLSVEVEAEAPVELQQALARCDRVCARWLAKYRVNHMLPSS